MTDSGIAFFSVGLKHKWKKRPGGDWVLCIRHAVHGNYNIHVASVIERKDGRVRGVYLGNKPTEFFGESLDDMKTIMLLEHVSRLEGLGYTHITELRTPSPSQTTGEKL